MIDTRRIALTAILTLALVTQPAMAARRRVLAASPSHVPLSISFLGNSGVMDAGVITSHDGEQSARSARTVTLRLGEPSRDPRGTATLRAFVESGDSRATIRINGIALGQAPQIIQRHVPIGIATAHRVEIVVPVTAAEGDLQLSIGWEVTTD